MGGYLRECQRERPYVGGKACYGHTAHLCQRQPESTPP